MKFGPKVQPACLPDPQNSDYEGAMSLVVGWGRVGEAEPTSTVLRSLVMPIWSQEQCRQSEYGANRLTNNMICAGFHDGQRDACKVIIIDCFPKIINHINHYFLCSIKGRQRRTVAHRGQHREHGNHWSCVLWTRLCPTQFTGSLYTCRQLSTLDSTENGTGMLMLAKARSAY